jgi:hypothetical protein
MKNGHKKLRVSGEMRLLLEPAVYREHLDLLLLINRNLKLHILVLEVMHLTSKRRMLVSNRFSP